MIGKINTLLTDDFTILDLNGSRLPGVDLSKIIKYLYNASGSEVSDSISVNLSELALGNYRASFIPNMKGIWKLVLIHSLYFPSGKETNYKIYEEDFDSISSATWDEQLKDHQITGSMGANQQFGVTKI